MEALITVAILCSNANYETSERCQAPIDYKVVNEDGTAWGALTSGVTFTQGNIINDYTRLQVFRAEEMHWYVSDKGIIYADTDLQALSIYGSL